MHRLSTRRVRAVSIAAIGAATALVLTGCAAPDEGASSTSASPKPSVTVTVDEAARALLPADIRDSGVLRVAVDPTVGAPASYLDGDTQTIVGSDPALSEVLAQSLGLKYEAVKMSFGSIISGLQAGRADIAMSSMGDTTERQTSVDFVDYVQGGLTLQVQKGNPAGITTYDALCGHSVGVTTGSYQETLVNEKSADCTKAGDDEIDVVVFPDGSNVLSALQSGRIEASATDMQIGAYSAAQNPDEFEIPSGADLVLGNIGVVVPKGEDDLTKAIQAGMQSLMDDGTYAEVLNAWGIADLGVDSATVNQAIAG